MKRKLTPLLFGLLLGLAACGGAAATNDVADTEPAIVEAVVESHEAAEDEAMGDDDDSMADEDTMNIEDTMSDDDSMAEAVPVALAAWQTIPLTNARTGETFTLGGFDGQTVFVEPMATWCTNCRNQLSTVQQAKAQLNGDDVQFVALSLETNIGDGDLANYANDLGFDWTFAVMSPELLQALADEFGRTITNAPSTPHFVIQPDGSYGELHTGFSSAEEIIAQTGS